MKDFACSHFTGRGADLNHWFDLLFPRSTKHIAIHFVSQAGRLEALVDQKLPTPARGNYFTQSKIWLNLKDAIKSRELDSGEEFIAPLLLADIAISIGVNELCRFGQMQCSMEHL